MPPRLTLAASFRCLKSWSDCPIHPSAFLPPRGMSNHNSLFVHSISYSLFFRRREGRVMTMPYRNLRGTSHHFTVRTFMLVWCELSTPFIALARQLAHQIARHIALHLNQQTSTSRRSSPPQRPHTSLSHSAFADQGIQDPKLGQLALALHTIRKIARPCCTLDPFICSPAS